MEPFKKAQDQVFLWRYLLDMDSLNVTFVSKDGLGCFGAKWRQHDCGILLLLQEFNKQEVNIEEQTC